jgi:uncharacterized protein (TIGR00251 family)
MRPLNLTVHADHIAVDVHVVPRASTTAVVGLHDGRMKLSLDAPPVDGEANRALIAFFAKALRLPKQDVRILRGASGRQKTLALHGATEAAVRALIGGE